MHMQYFSHGEMHIKVWEKTLVWVLVPGTTLLCNFPFFLKKKANLPNH